MVRAMSDPSSSRRAGRIEAALRATFAPDLIRVTDDSARHAGHAGAAPGGETHYTVVMAAAAFQGIAGWIAPAPCTWRAGKEFAGGLHALALTLRTPEEHARISAAETGG